MKKNMGGGRIWNLYVKGSQITYSYYMIRQQKDSFF